MFGLFEATPDDRAWQRDALLSAFAHARFPQPFVLSEEPIAVTALLRTSDVGIREKVLRALNHFTWPGATPPDTLTQNATPLTQEQAARIRVGQELYGMACVACHQPHGGGVPGVAPPLVGSEWVNGPAERIARVVLNGLYGPVEVNGHTWNLSMPAFGFYDDEQLASVLSYVRRAWGNAAAPVEPALMAEVRKDVDGRTLPWRAEELMQVAQDTGNVVAINVSENGDILLPASKATIFGQRLAYRATLDVLAPWVVAEDIVEWTVDVTQPGNYSVGVILAADDESAGDFYVIETEGSRTRAEVADTGGYDRFQEQPAGTLTLRKGLNRVLLRPDGPLKRALADVRGVRLVPVDHTSKQ